MAFWHFFEFLLNGVFANGDFLPFLNHCVVSKTNMFYMIRGDFAKFNYRIASIILFSFSMALNTRVGPQYSKPIVEGG